MLAPLTSDELLQQLPEIHPKRKMLMREFGLLCAPKEMEETQFMGGTTSASAIYMLKIITHPAFGKLTEQLLHRADAANIASLIPDIRDHLQQYLILHNALHKGKSGGKYIADTILEQCRSDPKGICYSPGGWGGERGHAVVIKHKLLYGSLVATCILNRGAGAETHNMVDGTHLMRQISSPPFEVNLGDAMGQQLVEEWASLFTCSRNVNPGALDLYGRLFIYGKQMEDNAPQQRAAKVQLSSNCSSASLNAMLADILHDRGESLDLYRQLMLVIRMFAILQEFSAYAWYSEKQIGNQILFKEAIDRMLTRAARLGPDLCNTKQIEVLCKEGKQILTDDKIARLRQQAEGRVIPAGNIASPKNTMQTTENHWSTVGNKKFDLPYDEVKAPLSTSDFINKLDLIEIILKNLGKDNPRDARIKVMLIVRDFFRTVPTTSNETFWGDLQPEAAKQLIEKIYAVTKKTINLFRPTEYNRLSKETIAKLSLLSLDMASECADHIPALKFNGQYTMRLSIMPGHGAVFTDPIAVRVFEQTKKNFDRRAASRILLFGNDLDLTNGPEAAYLFNAIIPKNDLKKYLEENRKKRKENLVKKYFIKASMGQKFIKKYPHWPGNEFKNIIKQLIDLSHQFIATGFDLSHIDSTPYQKNGESSLNINAEFTKTLSKSWLTLPLEHAHPRVADVNLVVDDRQNLIYLPDSVNDQLQNKNIGMVYISYFSNDYSRPLDSFYLEPALHRELCTLEAGRELRSLNTLDWMLRPHQFQHLKNPNVRDLLEALLFGYESALPTVREFKPELMRLLHQFMEKYEGEIKNNPGDHTEVLAWCTSVVDRFRYHFHLEGEPQQALNALQTRPFLYHYRAEFNQALSGSGAANLQRAIAHSYLGETDFDAHEFMHNIIRAASYGISMEQPGWPIILMIIRENLPHTLSLIMHSDHGNFLNALVNEILGSHHQFTWKPMTNSTTLFEGSSPECHCLFNMASGEIILDHGVLIDLLASDTNKDMRLAINKSSLMVTVTHELAMSADGEFRFTAYKQDNAYKVSTIFRRFTLKETSTSEGVIQYSRLQPEHMRPLDQHDLTALHELLGHHHVYQWAIGEKAKFRPRFGQNEYHKTAFYLFISKENPNIAIYRNHSNYLLMHLVDGAWLKSTRQFLFETPRKEGSEVKLDIDALLERAAPLFERHGSNPRKAGTLHSDNGFLYEDDRCIKIVIPSIKLSFTLMDGFWVCDQHQHYQLTNKASIAQLDTYTHVFVLEHSQTQKTRVLITPFDWKKSKATRGIENKPIINRSHRSLLSDEVFIFDIENNQLVSSNPAAHLYLALIFRAQRNYELALHHLNLSYHAGENSEAENKITERLNHFSLYTARAAAFDIQFLLRSRRHVEKFTNPNFKTDNKKFDLLLEEAVLHYRDSESRLRVGVNGIPETLQAPAWVLDAVHFEATLRVTPPQSTLLNQLEEYTDPSKASHYEIETMNNRYHSRPREWFKDFLENCKVKTSNARIDIGAADKSLSFSDLCQDFMALAQYAVHGDEFNQAKVRSYILTYLSQSDYTAGYHSEGKKAILVVLLFMLNNSAKFSRLLAANNPEECLASSLDFIRYDLQSTFKRALKTPCHLLPDMNLPKHRLQTRMSRPPLVTPAAIPAWTTPVVDEAIWTPWPAATFYEKYFEEERVKPYEHSRCSFSDWHSENALENNMIKSLQMAFENLRKSERSVHHASTDFNTETLAHAISYQAETLEIRIAAQEVELIALLNKTEPSTEQALKALQAAEEPGELTLQHVVEAMLSRSHAPLLRRNPTLTVADLTSIYQRMIAHQSLKIEYNQMQDAQKIIGSQVELNAVDIQRLGEVLFRKRQYDPGKYPEILIYASATGKDPNPSQLAILQKIFSILEEAIDLKRIEHLLLEFAAGGGKTSVLIPILVMFLSNKGMLAVISNTSNLYYQSLQELPPMLRAAIGQQLELIDRDVAHEWNIDELEALNLKLKRWHVHERRALLIKASSWHSLNSAKKIACYQAAVNNDADAKKRESLILEILDYFKQHAVLLEDECHISSDPHQETIRAFEIGQPVPMAHHDIYFKAYFTANHVHKTGTVIGESDRDAITKACIEIFLEHQPFKGLTWLRDYLSSPLTAPRPKALLALNKSDPDRADLVILAKTCIYHHLPFTGTLTLGKDYGDSTHPGDMTAAPRHDGRPSGAHYMDSMLVSALTIQKALEGGIPAHDLPTLVKGLREIYNNSLFKGEHITKIEAILRNALDDDAFLMKGMSDETLIQRMNNPRCLHHPYLIKKYLMNHALKQIRFQGRSVKSTPAEMAQGFNISIQLSATPGLTEIYSVLLRRDNLLDTEFSAEVLTVLMERNATGLILQDRSTPTAFIEEIATKCPEEFERLRAFIDKGGIFANFNPAVLAEAFSTIAAKHQLSRGVITWHDEKTIQLASTIDGQMQNDKDVISAFTLQQTTGRDNPSMGFQARGAMTLGKKVGSDDVVQGAMRQRKLLIPGAQTLFWCVMEDLWQTIVPDVKDFDINKAIRWTLENQAETFRSKVLMRAYQGIDAELHAIAWHCISKGDARARKMLEALCAEPYNKPWDIYAKDFHSENSNTVLNAHYHSLRKNLLLSDQEVPRETEKSIDQIIKQTSNLIEVISTSSHHSLLNIGFKQEEKQQQKQQELELNLQLQSTKQQSKSGHPKVAAEHYSADDRLEKRTLFVKFLFTKNENALDDRFTPFKVKGIHPNKLPVFSLPLADKLNPRLDWKTVIKPMSHILIKKREDGSFGYYALTEAGARFYVMNIRFLNKQKDTSTQAFLMTIGGALLAETLSVKPGERNAEINSARCRQVISLLALLANRPFDAHEMIAALHELKWSQSDFKAFCQHIYNVTPPSETTMPEKYEDDFRKMLGWGKTHPEAIAESYFSRRPLLVADEPDTQLKP